MALWRRFFSRKRATNTRKTGRNYFSAPIPGLNTVRAPTPLVSQPNTQIPNSEIEHDTLPLPRIQIIPDAQDAAAVTDGSHPLGIQHKFSQPSPRGTAEQLPTLPESLVANRQSIAIGSDTNAQLVHARDVSTSQTEQSSTPLAALTTSWPETTERSGTDTLSSVPMLAIPKYSRAERSSESPVSLRRSITRRTMAERSMARWSIVRRSYINAHPPGNGEAEDDDYTLDNASELSQVPSVTPNNIFEVVEVDELDTNDVIIMLLGPTGAGKSSFVNKAIGNEGDDVEHSLISCTSKIKATRCTIEGSRVVLVDTPGFNHTNISDLEILKLIADWLVKTKGKLLSGLLYFHRISDDFINGSLSKNLRVFQKLCGDNAMSHVVLTTTMWDEVDETFGKERLEELRESDWRAMIERGSRTFRYLNTQESAQELLLQLVGNKRCKLQLQKEMGGNRMQILKTSAARELRSPLGHIQQYDRYRAQQTQTSTKYPWNRPDVSNAPPQELALAPNNKSNVIRADEFGTGDVVIVLMGLTGTGKSSFVSMITGNQEQGVGHSLTSCTREIKTAKCTIEGSSVVLLDTPGFNHPEISDLKILQLITSWLNKTCKQGPLLSILYFHRITDNRMLWTPLKDFQRLCRNKPISNIVLTTTMWDEVDEDFGDERLKELRGNDWKTIFRYSNTQESAKEVLLQLMAVTEGN